MKSLYFIIIVELVVFFSIIQIQAYADSTSSNILSINNIVPQWKIHQIIGKFLNSNPPKPDQVFNLQYRVINGSLLNLTTDKYGQFVIHVEGNDKGFLDLRIPQNYPYSNILTDKPRAIIFVNGVDLLQKYSFEKSDCFFEYSVQFSGKSVITLGFLAYPGIPYSGNNVPNYCLHESSVIPEFPVAIPILCVSLVSAIVFYRIRVRK